MEKFRQMFLSKKGLIIVAGAAAAILVAVVLFFAVNSARSSDNHVKGVDVSAYQGDINWKKLADRSRCRWG